MKNWTSRSIILIAFCAVHVSLLGAIPKIRIVELVTACGFGPNVKLSYKCSPSIPPSVSDIISKMIAFNGNSPKGIRIEDSPGTDYPVTGRDISNNIIIIIDAQQILRLTGWNLKAVLAHELGHITNRDVYSQNCVSHEFELNADYYAGFWAHRAGCTNIDSVLAPFLNVLPDSDHPAHALRVNSVNKGWADEEIPFEFKPRVEAVGLPELKDSYGQYINIFATITPYMWQFRGVKKYVYKTKVLIGANDIRVPLDRLLSVIARVEYAANDRQFRFPLLLKANRANDFCYMVLGAKKTLPITCTIYFVDKSSMKVTKNFLL